MLEWVGVDAPDVARSKAESFRRFLLLALTVEFWEALHHWADQPYGGLHRGLAVLMTAAALAGWFGRFARPAVFFALALMAVELWLAFPINANHHWLLALLLLLYGFLGGRDEREPVLLVQSLRWLAVIGLFYAGLQKMLYGHYYHGVFLSYLIAETPDRFGAFFRLLIPAAEVDRLQAMTFGAGAGPYRVAWRPFVVISQLAYLGEVIPAPLLLVRGVRAAAVWTLVVYILVIELGAREVFFGALMLNLLFLFAAGDLNRRLLPWFGALYAAMWAMSVGLLPRMFFT